MRVILILIALLTLACDDQAPEPDPDVNVTVTWDRPDAVPLPDAHLAPDAAPQEQTWSCTCEGLTVNVCATDAEGAEDATGNAPCATEWSCTPTGEACKEGR